MYKIYVIKNKVNDKIYIGQTKQDMKKRFIGHVCKSNNGSKCAIHAAMRLYGINNFYYEILEDNLTLDEANEAEIRIIKEQNTLCPNGYNILKGGSDVPTMTGPFNQDHKDKLQKAHLKNAKPIIQFNIYTGEFIKEWISGKEIVRGGFNRANIIALCKSRQSYGYIYDCGWCYKEFYDLTENKATISNPNYNAHGKFVESLDKDGNVIKRYNKIADAAKELNCSPCSIADVLKGRTKTCKGFKWRYA